MSAAKLVTIYGGSGFLGRQIARALALQGWRVRVAVRRPNEAGVVRTYGAPGQIEPVPCNVRDDRSVTACMMDADAVINCVGVLVSEGKNTFDAIHQEAAGRIARISSQLGVARFVHVSALGADAKSDSRYAASKAKGEEEVLKHRPDAVILRPSVIFGSDDKFFNRLASAARLGPVMPLPAPKAKLQPVHVLDVAKAAAMGADGSAAPGIYELGGPEVVTMRELVGQVLTAIDRRKIVVGLPNWLTGALATIMDGVAVVSGGFVPNRFVTRDQLRALGHPNVASAGAKTFSDLGIVPTAAPAVIGEYLWRFRPSGQYEAMTASAKNLRQN